MAFEARKFEAAETKEEPSLDAEEHRKEETSEDKDNRKTEEKESKETKEKKAKQEKYTEPFKGKPLKADSIDPQNYAKESWQEDQEYLKERLNYNIERISWLVSELAAELQKKLNSDIGLDKEQREKLKQSFETTKSHLFEEQKKHHAEYQADLGRINNIYHYKKDPVKEEEERREEAEKNKKEEEPKQEKQEERTQEESGSKETESIPERIAQQELGLLGDEYNIIIGKIGRLNEPQFIELVQRVFKAPDIKGIKKAYHALAKEWHSDKEQPEGRSAINYIKMQVINILYSEYERRFKK